MNGSNELIAKFMGVVNDYAVHGNHYTLTPEVPVDLMGVIGGEMKEDWFVTKLRFHESWDWLIPVIIRCNNKLTNDDLLNEIYDEEIMNNLKSLDINFTYTSVIRFLERYNLIKEKLCNKS